MVRSWRPLRIIAENAGAYLVANAVVYGLFLVGFAAGLAFPQLTEARREVLDANGTTELVQSVFDNPWLFALVILGVNVIRMGALTIVAPSMIVPFAGLPLFGYWVVTTGVALVPPNDIGWVALIPHSVTLIIELQAYLVLLLGAYLLGRYWVRPDLAGVDTRRAAYRRGLQNLGWLALLAAVLLVVGAVYEAFSLRYAVHPLAELLLAGPGGAARS
ncbi:MAG: stage II sporulation protein M [Mycolicibacterium rufum]|nr:stage II sporulation protein M [Mycolicibacterium rufum]